MMSTVVDRFARQWSQFSNSVVVPTSLMEDDDRVHLQVRRRTTAPESQQEDLSIQILSKRAPHWIDVWHAGDECNQWKGFP